MTGTNDNLLEGTSTQWLAEDSRMNLLKIQIIESGWNSPRRAIFDRANYKRILVNLARDVLLPSPIVLRIFHEKTETVFSRMMRILDEETYWLTKGRDILMPRLMDGEVVV